MKRSQVIAYARTLVNVKYEHGGRNPAIQLDCVGVITAVCDRFNYPYRDITGYSRHPDGHLLRRFLESGDAVNRLSILPGDIGVFWLDRNTRVPQHVGIFSGTPVDLHIIHSDIREKKVVEVPLANRWRKCLISGVRFRGILDE